MNNSTLDRQPLDDVRSDRGKLEELLRHNGAQFDRSGKCRCLFHEDKHPSASIFQTKDGAWKYKCHVPTCNATGDYFDIQSRLSGRSSKDVIRDMVVPKKPIPPPAEDKPGWKTMQLAADWLAGKGAEIQKIYQYWDADKKHVIGAVLRIKAEDGGKDFKQLYNFPNGWKFSKPPGKWPLYNLHLIAKADHVVVCEGEKAADAAVELGLCGTTSIMGAGKDKPSYSDWGPLAGKRVTLWPDNDEAGAMHMEEVKNILFGLTPAPEIYMVDPTAHGLPPKGDAFDLLQIFKRELTAEQIKPTANDMICEAYPVVKRGLFGRFVDECISGEFKTIDFPSPLLTTLTKALRPGRVTMLCGDPNTGKSFFLTECMNFWKTQGIPHSAFFGEDDKQVYVSRAVAQHLGKADLLNDEWCRKNVREALEADNATTQFQFDFENRIWVESDSDRMPTFQKVIDWIKSRGKAGDRIVILDPVTAFGVGNDPKQDHWFLMQVKQIAREYKFSLILVTHPKQDRRLGQTTAAMAGGTTFERFTHTILWIGFMDKEAKTKVRRFEAEIDVNLNRMINALKVREAKGQGQWIGFHFDDTSLSFVEQGIIIKKSVKGAPNGKGTRF